MRVCFPGAGGNVGGTNDFGSSGNTGMMGSNTGGGVGGTNDFGSSGNPGSGGSGGKPRFACNIEAVFSRTS